MGKTIIFDYQSIKETDDGITSQPVYDLIGEDIDFDIRYINKQHETTSGSISIDRVISGLNTMKDEGSTHVEIDFHGGHDSYIFSGLTIRIASEEEEENFKLENIESKKAEILKIIKLKQNELVSLEEELKRI